MVETQWLDGAKQEAHKRGDKDYGSKEAKEKGRTPKGGRRLQPTNTMTSSIKDVFYLIEGKDEN